MKVNWKSYFQSRPTLRFHVNLHNDWVKAGSPATYKISKETGVARATIDRYIQDGGDNLAMLDVSFAVVATYLGVSDYRSRIELVSIGDDIDAEGGTNHHRRDAVA